MTEPRIKLLFVISKFEQGGSERYLFELCQALDKEKFEIDILTRKRINQSDYYYPKLRDMGVVIHRKMPLRRYLFRRFWPDLPYKVPAYKKFMDSVHRIQSTFQLRHFFDPYDLIAFIQIDNYYPLQHFFKDDGRVVVHLMSNAFQYSYDYYAECLPGRDYKFILMDPEQKEELKGSDCASAETMYFPLAIDTTSRESVFTIPEADASIKIGIVMRLSTQRPIEFFFYAFRDLLQDIDATLHVYGQGDPRMFYRTLDILRIRDKVFFEGQQKNLEKTLRTANLSVVWLTSNGPIMGYASVEVASFGMPMVFWNLYSSSYQEVLARTGGAMHSFSTVTEFVAFNKEILAHPGQLQSLGQKLCAYVLSEYDITKHIKVLEHYYVSVASKE